MDIIAVSQSFSDRGIKSSLGLSDLRRRRRGTPGQLLYSCGQIGYSGSTPGNVVDLIGKSMGDLNIRPYSTRISRLQDRYLLGSFSGLYSKKIVQVVLGYVWHRTGKELGLFLQGEQCMSGCSRILCRSYDSASFRPCRQLPFEESVNQLRQFFRSRFLRKELLLYPLFPLGGRPGGHQAISVLEIPLVGSCKYSSEVSQPVLPVGGLESVPSPYVTSKVIYKDPVSGVRTAHLIGPCNRGLQIIIELFLLLLCLGIVLLGLAIVLI